MENEPKSCRHCLLPIQAKARRCPHCESFQSFFASQQDPRFLWPVLAFVVVCCGGLIALAGYRGKADEPHFKAIEHARGVITKDGHNELFVVAKLTGVPAEQDKEWSYIHFRIDVHGEEGALIDSFQDSARVLLESDSETPVRLSGPLIARPEDVSSTTILVLSHRAPTRYDN